MRLFHWSLAPIAVGCALNFRPPELDWRAGRPWLEVGAAVAADETWRRPGLAAGIDLNPPIAGVVECRGRISMRSGTEEPMSLKKAVRVPDPSE